MHRRHFLLTPLLWPVLRQQALAAPLPSAAPVYASVTPDRRLRFPRDHGAHPDYRIEWWYVTGALDRPQPDIGFQLTFFRARSGKSEHLASPLAARQVLFAHAALTVPGDRLWHAERAARLHLGAGHATDDCDLYVGAWRISRAQRGASEILHLQMQSPRFSYDFTLTAQQPLLLQGDAGFSRKSRQAELASYYVSWPQLQVDGELLLDGKRLTAGGRAWFDHEWSSAILGGGAVGWDWIGINLDDGGALMAFRLRDARGNTVFAHAAWRTATGVLRQFSENEIAFHPLRHWRSARSGGNYPVAIEIHLGAQALRTLPVLDDQELVTHRPTKVVYWEGLVRTVGAFAGRGYLEMTGYAGRLAPTEP